jgi:hypothetical protein
MAYLANTWYVQYENGSIEPVANLATARYLVASKIAIRIINTNREVLATL